jgi:hypothetical protein
MPHMRIEQAFEFSGTTQNCREKALEFLNHAGFRVLEQTEGRLKFQRGQRGASWVTFSIEKCVTDLEVALGSVSADRGWCRLTYDIQARGQVLTHVDLKFIELELSALQEFIEYGKARNYRRDIKRWRIPHIIGFWAVLLMGMVTAPLARQILQPFEESFGVLLTKSFSVIAGLGAIIVAYAVFVLLSNVMVPVKLTYKMLKRFP